MIKAFQLYKPEMLDLVELWKLLKRPGLLRLNPAVWEKCEDISIDYAVMERADNLSAIPLLCGWSDLGDWSSVWRELGPDEKGISNTTNTHTDCEDALLHSMKAIKKWLDWARKTL